MLKSKLNRNLSRRSTAAMIVFCLGVILIRWLAVGGIVSAVPTMPPCLAALHRHGTRHRKRSILILAPHQDDETLCCAGIIAAASRANVPIKVVIATNGDFEGGRIGVTRMRESVAAMKHLGVAEDDVMFLGYGDTGWAAQMSVDKEHPVDISLLFRLYHSEPNKAFTGNVANHTYGDLPAHPDYHSVRFKTHANYTHASVLQDLTSLISDIMPTHIYTSSMYDGHGDHVGLFEFTTDALIAVKKSIPSYSPILYEYVVHSTDGDEDWPLRDQHDGPMTAFSPPSTLHKQTIWSWASSERIVVPMDMQVVPRSKNRKYQAIKMYSTQEGGILGEFLRAFVKVDEIFWPTDLSNLAYLATIEASSENLDDGRLAVKVADGKLDGSPRFPLHEWSSRGEGKGAWLQMKWDRLHTINHIVLYDCPNPKVNILHSMLLFSDGSRIDVDMLHTDGRPYEVHFTPKTVQWVRLEVLEAEGVGVGLSEMQVFPV